MLCSYHYNFCFPFFDAYRKQQQADFYHNFVFTFSWHFVFKCNIFSMDIEIKGWKHTSYIGALPPKNLTKASPKFDKRKRLWYLLSYEDLFENLTNVKYEYLIFHSLWHIKHVCKKRLRCAFFNKETYSTLRYCSILNLFKKSWPIFFFTIQFFTPKWPPK